MPNTYHDDFIKDHLEEFDLNNKKLLEIGGSNDVVATKLLNKFPKISSIDGIHLKDQDSFQKQKFKSQKMDARNMSFSDNHFDVIYSLATFEHISDLSAVFTECFRVLKPNGHLVAKWSPIWSAFNGMHLQAKLFPWAHLLLSQQEFTNYLAESKAYSTEKAPQITKTVFESKSLNRYFIKDYDKAIFDSDFEILNYEKGLIDENDILTKLKQAIKDKWVSEKTVDDFLKTYPKEDFETYKISLLAKKIL